MTKEYRNAYNAAVEQAVVFLEENLRNICNDPCDYVMVNLSYENKEDFIKAFKESMNTQTIRKGMNIQEMAVENAEKRLKEIDKLDFAVSALADYDNGLTQGFEYGANWAIRVTIDWLEWLERSGSARGGLIVKEMIEDYKRKMGYE